MFGNDTGDGQLCPLLKKNCVRHKCAWFTQVRGTNPNTGEELDKHACAIAWMPVLTIENSQQQRQTGAAVEGLRNQVNQGNQVIAAAARRAQGAITG
jgi:hypothetical protein